MTVLDVRPLTATARRHQSVADHPGPLPPDGCATLLPARHPHRDTMHARASAVVQALVEVVGGQRPLSHLIRCATPEVQDEVALHLETVAQVEAADGRRGVLPRARVASVHISRPSAHAAEVSARIAQGTRSRAMAVRLEAERGRRNEVRWTCTAVHWG